MIGIHHIWRLISKIYRKIKWNIGYKKYFKDYGEGTIMDKGVICGGNNIIIGKKCTINTGVVLNGGGKLIIGNHCRISAGAQIHTGGLDLNKSYINRPHVYSTVKIGDGVWVGAGSIILPGVKVGEGAVLAAGAIVTKNIPSFELWGGIPAKFIKKLKKK